MIPSDFLSQRLGIGSVQHLAQFGQDAGMSLADCLRDSRVPPEDLLNPQAEILAQQEVQVIRNLIRHLGDDFDIGFRAGQRYHLSSYGMWGLAMLTSHSLRQAGRMGLRYIDVAYHFVRVNLHEGQAFSHLDLDPSHLPSDVQRFLVARDLASVAAILHDLMPQRHIPFHAISLQFPRLAGMQRLEDTFQCPVLNHQPRNRLSVASHCLDWPLPQANSLTAALCETQCRELMARRRARLGYAGHIRSKLQTSLHRLPTMEQVANELNMTERTLRRQLDAEGTSWRGLLNEVRLLQAERLLLQEQVTVVTIAETLGYADISSFSHAFKRWKGLSPDQYRKQRLEEDVEA